MLSFLRKKKAQSLVEYVLILGAIIVAILFMQLYVRRAVSGRLRDASDDIGDQFSASAKYNYQVTRNTKITESTSNTTGATTTKYEYDDSTRTGQETLPMANAEPWKF